MAFGDIVAIFFWPTIALALFVCWKVRPYPKLGIAIPIIVALYGIPSIAAAYLLFWDFSLVAIFDFYFGLIVIGLMLLVASCRSEKRKSTPIAAGLAGLAGLICLVWGCWVLFADYCLQKEELQGQIQLLYSKHRPKGQTLHYAVINGRELHATKKQFGTLRHGDEVIVRVGRGSNYILSVEWTEANSPSYSVKPQQ
jgi:hypothetical protein